MNTNANNITNENSNRLNDILQNPRIYAGVLAFMYSIHFFNGLNTFVHISGVITSVTLAIALVDGIIKEIKH